MLQFVDSVLMQATKNRAFNAEIPLLNISIKDIIGVAELFTSALFEFFVMIQPFEERGIKSLAIKG